MEYAVYKLEFTTSVHFGNGMLSDTGVTFMQIHYSQRCI